MQIISPVTADTCTPCIGKLVCAVLRDGNRVFGYLQGVEGNRLILRDQPIATKTLSGKKRKKVKSRAFAPYPPYGAFPGGVLALDLALLVLLFAIPFIW